MDGEGTYAKVVHVVEFVHEILVVFLVPFDVFTRMYRPNEIHTVAVAGLHEFVYVACLVGGVGFAPVRRTVIGVVLGAINVFVEFVAAVIIDERQTHLMRPRLAIETFHNAAQRQVGIVVACEMGQLQLAFRSRRFENLLHCLQCVECTALVVAYDVDAFIAYGEQVCA